MSVHNALRAFEPGAAVEALLVFQLRAVGFPEPVLQHVFAPPGEDGRPVRRWRFDLAFPDRMLAVEIDGGLLTGGRHGGTASVVRDVEKRLAAAVLGWRVLHFMPSQVRSGEALRWLEAAFGRRLPPLEAASRTWPVGKVRRRRPAKVGRVASSEPLPDVADVGDPQELIISGHSSTDLFDDDAVAGRRHLMGRCADVGVCAAAG